MRAAMPISARHAGRYPEREAIGMLSADGPGFTSTRDSRRLSGGRSEGGRLLDAAFWTWATGYFYVPDSHGGARPLGIRSAA